MAVELRQAWVLARGRRQGSRGFCVLSLPLMAKSPGGWPGRAGSVGEPGTHLSGGLCGQGPPPWLLAWPGPLHVGLAASRESRAQGPTHCLGSLCQQEQEWGVQEEPREARRVGAAGRAVAGSRLAGSGVAGVCPNPRVLPSWARPPIYHARAPSLQGLTTAPGHSLSTGQSAKEARGLGSPRRASPPILFASKNFLLFQKIFYGSEIRLP